MDWPIFILCARSLGEQWAFAHNGQMSDGFIRRTQRLMTNGNAEHYAPVGTTDSELAFCYLLNRLKQPLKHAQLMRCCLLFDGTVPIFGGKWAV